MVTFGIVGTGWRSEFYLRVARACPDRFRCAGLVSRDAGAKQGFASRYGTRAVGTLDGLLKERPVFVVTSVPWKVNPEVVRDLAERGVAVLSETPPATSVEEMVPLCDLVKAGAKVQVAEQYHLQPLHAARIAFVQSGRIGRVTQAQLSVCHGYHGM